MEPLSANDPRMIGEFRLHAQLGAGGMGQVYLGFSPAGRAVAIKVIHPQFARDQEFLRRFSHEVAAASAVGGMYTAPVVDYDLKDSPPWLATAYVPGPTLAAVVSKHGPLPEAATWRLAAGLTEALQAVQAKGLVHRDLKPANVLLADSGPHVIDFGISRASGSMTQLTSAGMAIGTPGYMSPEQAQTQAVGPASDIFSLGCVLAYAAAGHPPFNGDNPASILYQIVSIEPDLSEIPPGLRQVIQACLKKNPADRPEPARLIAMINELGPATPVTLGSFWPGSVARVIATEQAAQTPTGLTPPGPLTGAAGSGRTSGSTSFASPAPAERTPTALAAPTPGQFASATGNAPMIPDGYYAAAAQGRSAQAPSGPAIPPMPAPPQAYGAQQPYGQVPPGQPPTGQASAYSAQAPAYPGQQQPSGGDALSQYAPARRKPATSEVPGRVQTAIRLMYAGFAATVLGALLALPVLGRYNHAATVAQNAAKVAQNAVTRDSLLRLGKSVRAESVRAVNQTNVWHTQNQMAGVMAIVLAADILGLACWAWLAVATRRGNGWTRIAGTVLLAVYSVAALLVVFDTKNDPGAEFTTLLVWALGVATVIPLWSQQAREFFYTWRKR
jgi:serine/threonine kinase PknH